MTNGNGTALVQQVEQVAQEVSVFGSDAGFNTAQRIAKAMSQSSVVPKDYQGNLPNVLVAMEYANRLGASVLAVMQNLDVIHGRPALRATFLIGTVNASGRFSPVRFRFQGDEGTDSWGCRAVAVDRESGEECVGPLVTIKLAKDEGWYGKSGSKWKTIPELMLMYRAGAWWTKVYCPELSLGIATSDEAYDIGPAPEERIRTVAAVLDSSDEVQTVRGTPISDPAPDTSPPKKHELESLRALLDKARAADATTSDLEEQAATALETKDGAAVRAAVIDLNRALLAKASQGDLGMEG